MKTDSYLTTFQKYLAKSGMELDLNKNKSIVNRYLIAEFARQLFGENQYYLILLKEDKMVNAVLERK